MNQEWAIILGTITISIIGYFIGAISPGIIISNMIFKTDIRQHYSGNTGATNASRVMGAEFGMLVLILDGLKLGLGLAIGKLITILPISNLESPIFINASIYLSSIFIIIGHCWPVYYNFKGGKGVGPYIGFLLFLNPIYFVTAICVWIIVVSISKIVSVASIITVILIFAGSWIFPLNNLAIHMWINHEELNSSYFLEKFWTPLIVGIISLIIIFKHSANIKRIIKGQENKISVHRSAKTN